MRYHSSCLGLIVVLEEANIAARLSMGLVLHCWISSCKLMKIWPQENMDSEIEAPLMRSAIGGYAEKALYEAEQLAEAIREDQTDFLPGRLAEEIRRTEAERQQAKLREAEKRKREAAAMDMPPPDSYAWSVVAGRQRSRTMQSSSRMDPGKEKKSVASSSQIQGYDPNYPGYTSQSASGRDTGGSYTPKTERVSPPLPPRHTLDLTSLVQSALEGIGAMNSRSCEEDLLFDEAVRKPAPPGTEDDVVMDESGSGQLDDLEAARRYLDEDDAL